MKPGESNKLAIRHMLETIFGPELVEMEYRFHPVRRWRFDYAVPSIRLAVEYDGFNFSGHGGRHTSLTGMSADHEKINTATIMGWRVIRLTKKNFDKKMTKGISSASQTITNASNAIKF